MNTRLSASAQTSKEEKISEAAKGSLEDVISISIELKDLTCPVTLNLFFDPVLAMPCGHGIENRISSNLLKGSCPTCRQDIMMFGTALDKKNMIDKVLSQHPEWYTQVYFNLDHFAEIVAHNQLATLLGQRFIKLLQHAATLLNDKALDGNQKNKTAVEVLTSTYQGRELLRKNEKIQALLTSESRKLKVEGKTIDEWLKGEVEEKKSLAVASARGMFATPSTVDNVWQRVVYGNEDGVLQMLRANPRLVEQKATVIDYSGREIENATPFQAALCTGDEIMAEKIKAIYLVHNSRNGQSVLQAQFNEVFPNGYAAHLAAQTTSANNFERDYLNPLIDAIQNAHAADLQAALDGYDNGSALIQALIAFKYEFNALSCREKVFNPYHLQKAFAKYDAKFEDWYGNVNNPDRWSRLDVFWRQAIGWEERYLSTNYAQAFCTGLSRMVDGHEPLQRILIFHNYITECDVNFFPLDTDPRSRLGIDFTIYSYYGTGGTAGEAHDEESWAPFMYRVYKTYIEQKQQPWERYAARADASRTATCLMQ